MGVEYGEIFVCKLNEGSWVYYFTLLDNWDAYCTDSALEMWNTVALTV
jgi:hypothetical protein